MDRKREKELDLARVSLSMESEEEEGLGFEVLVEGGRREVWSIYREVGACALTCVWDCDGGKKGKVNNTFCCGATLHHW